MSENTIGDLPMDEEALDDGALEALATSLSTPPPAELRTRILQHAERDAARLRAERQTRAWRVAGGVALAASLVLAILWSGASTRLDSARTALLRAEQDREVLVARVDAQKIEIERIDETLAVQSELVRLLGAPRLLTAKLVPPGGTDGHARVLLDPDSGAIALIGAGLPPPQPGRTYRLWAMRAEEPPLQAGQIAFDDQQFVLRAKGFADVAAVTEFAISLEGESDPSGPSGPVVLAGTVTR